MRTTHAILSVGLLIGTVLAEAAPALQWAPCQGINNSEYQCGMLTVPLNYQDPAAGNTQIAVIKYQQAGVSANNDLVFNFGGPWDVGTNTLPVLVQALQANNSPLLSNFTLIDFDPRGVGLSHNLNCSTPLLSQLANLNFASSEGVNQLISLNQQVGQTCAPQFNGFQNEMGTMATAEDLDQIRQALGVNQWSYVGYSYGTQLGSLYLSLYPQHIRAMVLDGNMPPIRDMQYIVMQTADAFEATLNVFFADCDANSSCPLYPNAEAAYDAAVAKIQISPIPTGAAARYLPLTLAHFYDAVYSTLPFTGMGKNSITPDMWANDLAAGIKQVNQDNDGTILGSLLVSGNPYNDITFAKKTISVVSSTSNMTYQAVICSDLDNHPDSSSVLTLAQSLRNRDPRIGAYIGSNLLSDCIGWPAKSQPLPQLSYPNNLAPVVLIANAADPETANIFSQELRNTIPNSILVTWEGAGHTAFLTNEPPGTCVADQVNAYLLNLTLPTQEQCDDVMNPTTPTSTKATQTKGLPHF